MNVNVLCRNPRHDRVIPRFSRYLADRNGWTLTAKPDEHAEVVYLSGYFESQIAKPWPSVPVAAYFTHREAEGSAKAHLFDNVAERVQLRIATAAMYADYLAQFGPTVQIKPPVERDRFTIPEHRNDGRLVAGFSGFTYRSGRKGADLAKDAVESSVGQKLTWKASGRGWPVRVQKLSWKQMPAFMQGLDILVCPSVIEGVPMPTLEALSCGVSVVVPREVGLLDELPDTLGIHRYERGVSRSLIGALAYAVEARADVDREALRAVTEEYTIENWCERHRQAVELLAAGNELDAGIGSDEVLQERPLQERVLQEREPQQRGTESRRGIFCVAFGDPARESCKRMMHSAKKHMPDIPICLCAASPIGVEDVFIEEADSDIGGRRAKLKAYELAPAEWETVLYLDADTKVVAPITNYFEWLEDGWELVICKDISPNDVLGNIRRKVHSAEASATQEVTGTWYVLQLNGGAWAFRRCEAVAAFFRAWRREWERWAQRDQGALIRALYTHPLRLLLLGNEWNTFPKFQPHQETAGLLHFPGEARRWTGQIRSRLDEPGAWAATKRFEQQRRRRHG
ncbi:MAG: glycosyltransferase [Anaerolineae bacterium]